MSKEQKQLSKEDLTLWVNFVVTGKVEKGTGETAKSYF
ncbi:hypothetical protein [Listeria phage List-36]|uniref:Uncharacterized protein n=1 Tax=Listeria phage List-36 TaxID=1486422 RepID=A0A060AFS6_9CAUD|nr:hypothetical protein HH35_gp055 [Listeria phage List-36]AIA64224.1 hypothetical protein [Listeria phage List-36]